MSSDVGLVVKLCSTIFPDKCKYTLLIAEVYLYMVSKIYVVHKKPSGVYDQVLINLSNN